MPTFHHTARIHGRSARAGRRSAEQTVAYVHGTYVYSPRFDAWYDHRSKDDVVATDVRLPSTAPSAWRDPGNFARAVDAAEPRRDAQLLREIECQLPSEAVVLQPDGRYVVRPDALEVVWDHADDLVRQGMAVLVGVHLNVKRTRDAETGAPVEVPRPGAHLLATMREVTADGRLGQKRRDWNDPSFYRALRHAWEDRLNDLLARLGSSTRVTRRSYRDFGLPVDGSVKLGRAPSDPGEPPHRSFVVLDRFGEERLLDEWRRPSVHARVADANGARLLDDPAVAVSMAAVWKAPGADVTRRDIKRVLHTHTRTRSQYFAVLEAIDRRYAPAVANQLGAPEDRDETVIARAGEGHDWTPVATPNTFGTEPRESQNPEEEETERPVLVVRPDTLDASASDVSRAPDPASGFEIDDAASRIAMFGEFTEERVLDVFKRAYDRGWFDVTLEFPAPESLPPQADEIIQRCLGRAYDEGAEIRAGEGHDWAPVSTLDTIEPEQDDGQDANETERPKLVVRPDALDATASKVPEAADPSSGFDVDESASRIALFGEFTQEHVLEVFKRAYDRGWLDVTLEFPTPDALPPQADEIIQRCLERVYDEGAEIHVTDPPDFDVQRPQPP